MIEVFAFLAIGNFFRSPLFGSGSDMAQLGNVGLGYVDAQLRKKRVIVQIGCSGDRHGSRARQESLTVKRFKQGAALGQFPQSVKTHGIQPLEYIARFAVLRRMTVPIYKILDFFETGNDSLLAGVRPVSFFASTSTPSSSRRASSSSVKTLATGRLRLHARKEGDPFGHALFPRIA